MASILAISSRRWPAKLLIGGAVLLSVLGYVAASFCIDSSKLDTGTPGMSGKAGGSEVMPVLNPTDPAARQARGVAVSGGPLFAEVGTRAQAFTAEDAAEALRAFFDKILKQEDLSPNEADNLRERILASIESNPGAVDVVTRFYRDMPAEQGMERDMLRTILLSSDVGRAIVLQEANAIWESKSEPKFAEMYETYFNLPGTAPPDLMTRALTDLKKGLPSDERTAVARLNFIGSLEEKTTPDAANVRSDALQLLSHLAEGQSSELVRALAVQKLYRLSSPAEAANIAVGQLAKGAYPDLVRETLSSAYSGDVELTPTLRGALITATIRPGATPEERLLLNKVLSMPR